MKFEVTIPKGGRLLDASTLRQPRRIRDRFACRVRLFELDSPERISIKEQWASELRFMAERYPRKFAELVDGTGDATTGDVLIQLAAFGELRYG
jgi:hypothetical protein